MPHCGLDAGGENSRFPFDFAQGRLSTSLRSGRDDNFVLQCVRVAKKTGIPIIKSQALRVTEVALPSGLE